MQTKPATVVLFLSLVLVGASLDAFNFAKAETSVSGLITNDTTWTKADSPIQLTGNVAVSSGITLTIEPGVVVNFADLFIRINGTLVCQGTSADKVVLNGGELQFTQVSVGWNEQAGAGSIVEYTKANFIRTSSASPKIANCEIRILQVSGGAPLIEDNVFPDGHYTPVSLTSDTSANLKNNVIGYTNQESIYMELQGGGHPTLTGNSIGGGIQIGGYSGEATLTQNTIGASYPGNGNRKASITIQHVSATISGNQIGGDIVVSGGGLVLFDYPATATITDNVISGGQIVTGGTTTIQRNIIKDAPEAGIMLTNYALVEDNTIRNNQIGVDIRLGSDYTGQQPVVENNNIVDNTENSVALNSAGGFSMPNNWWGTTDSNAIDVSIYDGNDDFRLGILTYTPFLTQKNPTPNLTPVHSPRQTHPHPQPQPQHRTPTQPKTATTKTPHSPSTPQHSP